MELTITKRGAAVVNAAWSLSELRIELARPLGSGSIIHYATEEGGKDEVFTAEDTVAQVLAATDTTNWPAILLQLGVTSYEGRADFLKGAASQNWLLAPRLIVQARAKGSGTEILYAGINKQRVRRLTISQTPAQLLAAAGDPYLFELVASRIDHQALPSAQTLLLNRDNVVNTIANYPGTGGLSCLAYRNNVLTGTRPRLYFFTPPEEP